VQALASVRKAGDVVGSGYVLASLLGEGASAEVWLAHRGSQAVALKIVRPEYARKPRFLQRFEREVGLLAGLMHPGIPRLYDADLRPEAPFVAMAVAPGLPLDRWLRERAERGQSPALKSITRILEGAAEALGHAHAHGIIHRDLKPANIAWDEESGRVMVLDLGLAKRVDEVTSDQTTVGRVLGTPLYLAPEQVEAKAVSPRTDVFALSSIAFELFTLRHAWGRDGEDRPLTVRVAVDSSDPFNSALAIALRVLSGLPPRVTAVAPAWPATLDDALALGWAKDPGQRPETPEALAALITAGAGGQAVRKLAPPLASTEIGQRSDTKPMLPAASEHTDPLATPPARTAPLAEAPDTAPSLPALLTRTALSPRPATASRWPWIAGASGIAGIAVALALPRPMPPPTLTAATPTPTASAPTVPAATEAAPTAPAPTVSAATAPATSQAAAAPAVASQVVATPAPTAPAAPVGARVELKAAPRVRTSAAPPSLPPPSAPASAAPLRDPPTGEVDLEAELRALQAQPGDGARLTAFVEAIMRRAARLPEAKRRGPEALARRALFGGGPAQAKAALEALRRAEAGAQ